MARKTYKAEQIIGMLREADVRLSQGEKVGAICRKLSILEQSYATKAESESPAHCGSARGLSRCAFCERRAIEALGFFGAIVLDRYYEHGAQGEDRRSDAFIEFP